MTEEYSQETASDATAGIPGEFTALNVANSTASTATSENASSTYDDTFLGYGNASSFYTVPENDTTASAGLLQYAYQLAMSAGFRADGDTNNYNTTNSMSGIYSNVSTSVANTTEWVPTSYLLSGYSHLHVALSSIIVTAIMIGIVFGNVLVILAIAKDRNLQSIQNWFITSLAVADLLVGATVMPFSLANELMGWWYFGDILCELWLAVDVLLSTASILNLCLISLDRYWSITRAITYVKFRTRKRAVVMIATVWILSAIICFPPLVGWKRPQRKLYDFPLCELTDDIGYVLYSTLGSFYIPLVVMVVVYFKIYLAARSRARRGLKKKKKTTAMGNGKSTSTSTTTTTSFSTSTRGHKCMDNDDEHDKGMSSEDEDNCPPLDDLDSPSTDPDPGPGESIKLNSNLADTNFPKTKTFEERRKLLSDDTDVTDSADSSRPILLPPSVNNRHARKLHFTDSESTSDCSYGHARQNVAFRLPKQECIIENENYKPLLEDQSAESNRDSDKVSCEPETEVWVKRPELIVNNLHHDASTQNNNGNHITPCQQKSARAKKKLNILNVSNLSRTGSILSRKKDNIEKDKEKEKQIPKRSIDDAEKTKRRIAKARERRATIVLGIIMAVFTLCWLPFFLSYLIVSLARIDAPKMLFAIFFWAGYCNSALNPVIYTIFNKDFRNAFKKLLSGKRHH